MYVCKCKIKVLGADRLNASILRPAAKSIQIKLGEFHRVKKSPFWGMLSPFLGITKPAVREV